MNANTKPDPITTAPQPSQAPAINPGPLQLNAAAISQANSASQFDAGDGLASEARAVYLEGLKALAPREDWTPEQAAFMAARAEGWRQLCEQSYNDVINRRGSWVPWTVAGRSGYNARKMNARADAQMRAGLEWAEKRERYLANTKKALRAMRPLEVQLDAYRRGSEEPISSDDPHALEKLDARLEHLNQAHERYKAINAHYRKHKTMQGYPGIEDHRAASMDQAIKEDWRPNPVPFPAYVLQNSSANIRRLTQRRAQIAKAQERASQPASDNAGQTFQGFQVLEDAQTNRLKIIFDDKPDADTRALLKSNGFRWAPSAGAWQRQLTTAARYALKFILPKLAPEDQELDNQAPDAQEPETVTLQDLAQRISR